MNKSPIDALKDVVEETFGHRILSAGDCLRLCDAIHKKTFHKLNINTVRRYLGLVKTAYKPSVSTLNIFAQYCGFNGYSHFLQHLNAPSKLETRGDTEKKLMHYLVSLFKNTEVQHKNDPAFLSVVKQTILFLKLEPHLVSPFQKAIAKTKNGQTFYFEQFINIDKLASHYGDGLEHYLAEKKSKNAQVFGNALLCFRSWLTEDREGIIKYYNRVAQYEIDATTHPYISGQYFAANLFCAAVTGGDIEKVASEARVFYRHIKPSKEDYRFFPGFEMVLADALLLLKQYDEALFYIEAALKKKEAQLPPYMDKQLYNVFQLFYAVALTGTGEKEKGREVAEKIVTNEFYFLRKKYYSIYYLLLKQAFRQQDQKINTQLAYLTACTGFKFFDNYKLMKM